MPVLVCVQPPGVPVPEAEAKEIFAEAFAAADPYHAALLLLERCSVQELNHLRLTALAPILRRVAAEAGGPVACYHCGNLRVIA